MKRVLLTSLIWCVGMTFLGFILLLLGLREPTGYVPWVNPIDIFFMTYWFFLAAAIIYFLTLTKLNWSIWIAAFISVLTIYIIIIIPLILDDDYWDYFDWQVPVFIFIQMLFLILSDKLVQQKILKNKK